MCEACNARVDWHNARDELSRATAWLTAEQIRAIIQMIEKEKYAS